MKTTRFRCRGGEGRVERRPTRVAVCAAPPRAQYCMNVKRFMDQEIRQAVRGPPSVTPGAHRALGAPHRPRRTPDRARAARAPALVQSVRPGHNATHTAAHVDGSLLAMLVAPRSALSPRSPGAAGGPGGNARHTARRIHTHTHGNMHKIRTALSSHGTHGLTFVLRRRTMRDTRDHSPPQRKCSCARRRVRSRDLQQSTSATQAPYDVCKS